jgi:cytochrome c-type biogenesis protein
VTVGLLAAFLAGALSISSPCVLPLVPLYLAHLAGVGGAGREPERRTVLVHAVAFVLGFGAIFVLFGVSLGALGGVFLAYRDLIVRLGGVFMVILGLQLVGLLQLPFLGGYHRVAVPGARTGTGQVSSSFLVGVSFAAGWTPCVGPVLGAILTLAVSAADPLAAGGLLVAYAAGLAVPFLAAACAFGGMTAFLRRISGRVNLVSGVVLVAIGALMISGIYQQLFARIVGLAPWTPWEPTF